MARRGTPYAHRCWPNLRLRVLRRDGRRCQIKGPGCTSVANECDHIIPWMPPHNGPWFELSNLRAACTHCNKGRRNQPATFVSVASREW